MHYLRCELEVQEASRSKFAGSPEVLSTVLAMVEAPVRRALNIVQNCMDAAWTAVHAYR